MQIILLPLILNLFILLQITAQTLDAMSYDIWFLGLLSYANITEIQK